MRYHHSQETKPHVSDKACGFPGAGATGNLPVGVFSDAENTADGIGVDLLALGKQGGSIFNPEHWMHEEERDSFCDLLEYMHKRVFE